MNDKTRAEILVDFLKERYGDIIKKHSGRNKTVFQTLIACVLSQRTRDENTARAAGNLFSVADIPEKILKLPDKKLQGLIRPSGPYRQKAKRIREISKIILEKYKGKIPKNRKKLMSLPGVGFKTADIVLSYGFGIPKIAVDTHVNQISKRMGFAREGDSVEDVRIKLEKIIPGKDKLVVNIGLVNFGREICQPIKPKCWLCSLTNICEYPNKNLKSLN